MRCRRGGAQKRGNIDGRFLLTSLSSHPEIQNGFSFNLGFGERYHEGIEYLCMLKILLNSYLLCG
jgi:hypothetical protein